MNIKEIPRTLEAVRNLPTNIRYRIAMQVGAIPSEKDAIAALAERPLDEQASMILAKLLEIDAAGGQLPAMPPPAPQVIRNPDPMPQQVPPAQMPQQLGVPQQLGAPQQVQMPQQMPAQMPAQVPQQVPPQPLRTPSPETAPANNTAAAQSAVAIASLRDLSSQLGKLNEKIDTEVPGFEEHEELKDMIMGLATSVNTMVILGLLILEKAHNDLMPRNLIYDIVREEMTARTSEQLMLALRGPNQGK